MKMTRLIGAMVAVAISIFSLTAQNSAPRPGNGASFQPAGNSAPAPGSGGAFTPTPAQGPGWSGAGFGPNVPMWGTSGSMMQGGAWGPGAFSGPYYSGPGFDVGNSKVVAVGYDAQGVWETVPMMIHWKWNGFYYDITVVNAWNPWTQVWEYNLGIPAYQTEYQLRGITYTYYANLSTGTYYFNP